LWQAVAYPATVAIVAMILLGFLTVYLSNSFQTLFTDFGLKLPMATRQLFWWRDTGVWLIVLFMVVFWVVCIAYRRHVGPARWARLVSSFPIIGPVHYFRGVAEWSSLMSVLVKNRVPVPDALRWTADGISNAWIAQSSRSWAEEAASGCSVSELLASRTEFPRGLTPIVQWGEKNGLLAEAFSIGREMLERRVRVRAEMLRTILPPVLFLVIGCFVAMLLVGLFMPLLTLIQGLV
jgi:type II secretory pathway component PulF